VSFDDYAFDPKLRTADVVYAEGLEKLRYVENRDWALQLFNLWQTIHNPQHVARVSRVEKEKKREEMVDLAKRAHAGKLGEDEQNLAIDVFGFTFNEMVTNSQLGSFWRGYSALRQSRANRVTGDE
jgi:hypothetical protein